MRILMHLTTASLLYIYIYIYIYICMYVCICTYIFLYFAWEDQSENECYICHIALETCLECYVVI